MKVLIYIMIYLGSALMIFNIVGFILYAKKIKYRNGFRKETYVLHIPIILLILFLLGYLAVGIFGNPDLIVSGILFGGSIFVFVMYLLLNKITNRLFENEKLEAKLIAVEESNKTKTAFLSGISHEMRTPLNIILGLTSLSMTDNNISDVERERVKKAEASAKYLLSIINNILDMNSLENGLFSIKNEVFLIDDMIEQINSVIESLCKNKEINYQCIFDDSASGYYNGDEMRVKQIILNILDNAIKYTNNKGNIKFEVKKEEVNKIKFIIEDNGCGISEEFLPKIFDAFSREDSSMTSRHSGSGLGLSLTKGIIDALGGTIEVTSKVNVGSTFTVILPLGFVSKYDGKQTVGLESLEGCRILIVEDIEENAEIVADLLELEGATSEHAINGKVALEMFEKSAPGYYDAILMDLRMPVMDGITATREIRNLKKKDSKTIPIIALTANAFENDIKDSFNAGMNAHLSKPADSDKLFITLKKYIKKINY